ncbi:MAG TPA: tetratricopeptide repeat protein [Bacteroidia bacterium]|jgi:tetratricopeptide (TPR) repeat protein|nr:tetratricopeptide repeat protein [Bacteroidia bacterium]
MKKNIQLILLSSFLTLGTQTIFAQTDKTAEAFSSSYDKEYSKDYTGAITALKTVYDAKSYEINLRLGWLEYEAGQYKESMISYQTAIDLMPYSVEARLGYTYPAASLGNTDQLVTQYTKILGIDPQNSTANYQMGLIYYNKKDYQNAFNHLEKVVNLYPFSYNGLILYAWTNYRLGKTREAKVLFTKVLWLSPADKSALEGLGLIK